MWVLEHDRMKMMCLAILLTAQHGKLDPMEGFPTGRVMPMEMATRRAQERMPEVAGMKRDSQMLINFKCKKNNFTMKKCWPSPT